MVYKVQKTLKIFLIIIIALFAISNNVNGADETTLYLDGAKNNNFVKLTYDNGFKSLPNIKINEEMLNRQSNVFCMNAGEAFYGTRKCYEQIYFSIEGTEVKFYLDGQEKTYNTNFYAQNKTGVNFEYYYNGNRWTASENAVRNFGRDFHQGNDIYNLLSAENRYKLAYILSEVPKPALSKIGRFASEYQQAIWYLQNSSYKIHKDYIEETNALLAGANAYSSYVKEGYIDKFPTMKVDKVEKIDNKTFKIPLEGYYVTTGTVGGQSVKYGEIVKVDILDENGNDLDMNVGFNADYNSQTLTFTLNKDLSAYSKIKIRITQNNQYRNAYFWLLRCNGSEVVSSRVWNSNYYWVELNRYYTLNYYDNVNYCKECGRGLSHATFDYYCELCNKKTLAGTTVYSIYCPGCTKTRYENFAPDKTICCSKIPTCKKIQSATTDICTCLTDVNAGKTNSNFLWQEYMVCTNPECSTKYVDMTVTSTSIKKDGEALSIKLKDGFIEEAYHYCDIEEIETEITAEEYITIQQANAKKMIVTYDDSDGDGDKVFCDFDLKELTCPGCKEKGKMTIEKNDCYEHIGSIQTWRSYTGCSCHKCLLIHDKINQGIKEDYIEYDIIIPKYFLHCIDENCKYGIGVGEAWLWEDAYIGYSYKEEVEGTFHYTDNVLLCLDTEDTNGCYKAFAIDQQPQIMNVGRMNGGLDWVTNGGYVTESTDGNIFQMGLSEDVTSSIKNNTQTINGYQNLIAGGGSSSSGTAEATINVQTVIDKLEIIKENAATLSRMDVPLTLEITGASKAIIEGEEKTVNNGSITAENVRTQTDGILIENIVLASGNKKITLTISEPNIAGYLQWSVPLVLEITKTNNGISVTRVSGPEFLTLNNGYKGYNEYWYYTGNITTSGNTAEITVTNIPLINVKGVVYLDGQAGVKDVQAPDGLKQDGEAGIEGIKVYLKDKNDNTIEETTTDANGNYSFKGILAQEYYISYEYNGMKYESSKNQEVTEYRDAFNETFTTFNYNSSIKAKNSINTVRDNEYTIITADTKERKIEDINKDYINLSKEQLGLFVAKPIGTVISAVSGINATYTNVTQNQKPDIDIEFADGHLFICHSYGLLERSADLALGVKVDTITVSTNGQTSTEKFGTVNTEKDVDLAENRNIEYNKALAEIDYNFTMEDYKNIWGLTEFEESAKFEQTTMDITYLIEIKNVCTRDGKVNKIKIRENENLKQATRNEDIEYYYSNNPTVNILDSSIASDGTIDISKIGNIGTTQSVYLKITYTDIPKEYIQKDNTFDLEAEILEYSTLEVVFADGWKTSPNMVDIDSRPGNYFTDGISEDDNGKATVKLTTNETAERTITGIVFEDGKTEQAENYKFGNGNFDNGEEKLNGVVVQLIELKDVEILTQIYTCEYLWQETVTGSNVVKRISDDGTEIIVETHDEEIGKGQYLFKDVLPGTYIVRFRYGETYADNYVKVADGDVVSIDTYNGINYKSTTDENYNQEWYNKSNYTNGQAPSVARDIEAKRLELMSKTVVASTANGVTDKGMVAQTSKINIAQSTDSLENTNATILYDSVNSKKIEFDNISFGLELRPQTEISLEKHITGLSIVNGRNVFLTYTEDPENPDKEFPNLKSKLIGTRDIRGRFVFETDTELLQGADLKVSYTYTIKNISDKDYLSKDLIDKYASSTPEGYANYLKDKAQGINNKTDEGYDIGKYVGTQYYTGVVDTNEVSEVALKVEEMVDYLNNDFEYSNQLGNAEFEIVDTKDKLAYVKANPNAADGATVAYKEETGHANNGLKSKNPTRILKGGESATKTATINKKEKLSPTENLKFIGYNAEITDYSIPSGRISSIQGVNNINYVVTEDDSKGPEETDESWSENLEITKNTGIKDDQNNMVQIITISTTVIAIITAGAIAVKKFVIK